ncbi:MAG TPA: histidine phosphatase family protein [Motiliproteus sp.]
MKRLLLLRHAKSSWKQPQLADHDRPLNRRGERNCRQLADYVSTHPHGCACVHSSTALRARLTAAAIAQDTEVQLFKQLYTFTPRALIEHLRQLDDALDSLVLVGHNPALTELVNWLGGDPLGNLPTASWVEFELAIEHWGQLAKGCASLQRLVRIKALASSDEALGFLP